MGQANLTKGIFDDVIRGVIKAKRHPHHSYSGSRYFDIATLEISPVQFTYDVRIICLPQEATQDDLRKKPIPARLIGWGSDGSDSGASDILGEISLSVLTTRYKILSLTQQCIKG